MKFHCLFEQSGTFKNVFKSHGHEAWDYDILNNYGQTDFKIDLFNEIQVAYNKLTQDKEWLIKYYELDYITIFDKMKPETDFIIAFYPCTMFTDLNENQFRMIYGKANPTIDKVCVERTLKRIQDRANYFSLWNKFCFICQELKIPTIIENPIGNNKRNYLKLYSAWQPKYDEPDRTRFGDKFRKPTHYFAINFDMVENFQMYDKEWFNTATILSSGLSRVERSEITPRYADNFYKRFLQDRV